MKKEIKIAYEEYSHWSELTQEDVTLVEAAFDIAKTAYAPYSKFNVGAALKMKTGKIITGSNQENIAYPSGLCAERVALFYAGANFPNEIIETICVIAKGVLVPFDQLLSPCGGCRQVMMETQNRQKEKVRVILVSQNGTTVLFNSVDDLLPMSFG